MTAGFFGGWYDHVMSRIIDVLFGLPWLVFVIALAAIAPAQVWQQLAAKQVPRAGAEGGGGDHEGASPQG